MKTPKFRIMLGKTGTPILKLTPKPKKPREQLPIELCTFSKPGLISPISLTPSNSLHDHTPGTDLLPTSSTETLCEDEYVSIPDKTKTNTRFKMIEVEDMAGVKMKVGIDVDGFITPVVQYSPEETKKIFHKLPDFKFRKDDIIICAYQKTGTNWLYEILSMVNNRSAERVKTNKMRSMIDVIPKEELDKLPSPRVLNCHLPLRYLPTDMIDSKVKTVLCFRNPKDTAVSFYNFTKGLKLMDYNGKFKDWLPVYLQGKLTYGKYTDYLKEWEKAIKDGVEFPLHFLYYEDLKLNGMQELERLLHFLEVDIDKQLKKDILEACDFDNMSLEKTSADKDIIDLMFHPGCSFFRKGQIGDWKNWFTVAQDEMFDEVWVKEMKDSEMFKFIYTDPRVAGQNEVQDH